MLLLQSLKINIFIIICNYIIIVIIFCISFIYVEAFNLQSTFLCIISFEPHSFIIREKRQALLSNFSIRKKIHDWRFGVDYSGSLS